MQIYFIDLSLRFCNVLIIGKENGKNITSVGSARGSTFVQRTSIGESKGYSVVSSDMNVQAHIKIIRQPNFNPIEHATSFPHLKQYKRLWELNQVLYTVGQLCVLEMQVELPPP